ncbi:MAG: hypothetical protein OXG79_01435 [Chloroflexi bacterium]|nr:hypothetical protein [Chloroflexota bacterium]
MSRLTLRTASPEVVTTPWLGLNQMYVLTETTLLRDQMRGLLG